MALLRSNDFNVTPHAYGIGTSFEAEYGSGGSLLVFNAEYDALPGIGHACGHNLIAVAALAGFFAIAATLREYKIPGRVRILGTPAEEGGGGKLPLIAAGAYQGVTACLMIHPFPNAEAMGGAGNAYFTTLARHKIIARYTGRTAHAAAAPERGLNALDAVVLSYNGISMLRQQMKNTDSIHGVILEGGKRPNVIPREAALEYYVRSLTLRDADDLLERVKKCFDAGASATGCSVEYIHDRRWDLKPQIFYIQD